MKLITELSEEEFDELSYAGEHIRKGWTGLKYDIIVPEKTIHIDKSQSILFLENDKVLIDIRENNCKFTQIELKTLKIQFNDLIPETDMKQIKDFLEENKELFNLFWNFKITTLKFYKNIKKLKGE